MRVFEQKYLGKNCFVKISIDYYSKVLIIKLKEMFLVKYCFSGVRVKQKCNVYANVFVAAINYERDERKIRSDSVI